MSEQSVSFQELVSWKREVAALYSVVRNSQLDPQETLAQFRQTRDGLFRDHPATPLDQVTLRTFSEISYFGYHSEWKVQAEIEWLNGEDSFVVTLPDGDATMQPAASIRFQSPLTGASQSLQMYWLKGYGGGLFLPFRDSTNSDSTYGGGRYLYDTIKSADLGFESPFYLDFNYAYNPSCAYSPQWVCPLAPSENMIGEAIEAGEKTWSK